ncbi:MAG TPA: CoA-binding protein [Thermoplasmata archaeon]|nr:CoA-binding protein [Thermoplasmata archaeon]
MNPPDDELRRLLTGARTLAVIGLSDKPERDSNEVARYLRSQGYRIVPVNPALPEVLGERSYPSLAAIPPDVRVDIAVVFRKSEAVPPIVDEAIARRVPVLWMQLGVEHPEAAARARSRGVVVVENLCTMATHRRLQLGRVA